MRDHDDYGGTLSEEEWQDLENESSNGLTENDMTIHEHMPEPNDKNDVACCESGNYIYVTAHALQKCRNLAIITLHAYVDCPAVKADYKGSPNSGSVTLHFSTIERRNAFASRHKWCQMCENRTQQEATIDACEYLAAIQKEDESILAQWDAEEQKRQTEAMMTLEEIKKEEQDALEDFYKGCS